MKKFAILALLAALGAGSAHAAINVPVMSGGVGQNSRDAIAQVQNDFSLKVVFTGQQGIYLSNVKVQILNAKTGEEVVSNLTQGPILLAGLAPGNYTMQATVDGFMQKQKFTVGAAAGLKTLHVRFPVRDASSDGYSYSETY